MFILQVDRKVYSKFAIQNLYKGEERVEKSPHQCIWVGPTGRVNELNISIKHKLSCMIGKTAISWEGRTTTSSASLAIIH